MKDDSTVLSPSRAPATSEAPQGAEDVSHQSGSSSNGGAVPAAVDAIMRPPRSPKSNDAQGKESTKEQS